jgi:hypothetical protein
MGECHVFNKARWNIVANEGLLYSFIVSYVSPTGFYKLPLDVVYNQANRIPVNKVIRTCCLLERECTEIQSLNVKIDAVTGEESK